MNRLDLVRYGPYRLLFPIGVLCGLIGVGHWLFWSLGWVAEGRTFFHATLQVQGFLTCFAVGFLMTALPRFLGAAPASLFEVGCVLAASLAFILFVCLTRWTASQAAFL